MSRLPSPNTASAVWAVDGDHSLWDALTWVDQLLSVTTKVFSLYDLVKVCQYYAIQNSCAIDYLTIFGHGTRGYQSVGVGKRVEVSGTKSLLYKGIAAPGESHLYGPAESIIGGLNGVLSDNAQIFLAGCNVGEGDEGSGLLTTISGILNGRAVQAFETSTYWWTRVLIGSLKEADGSDVSSSFSCYTIE